MAERFARLPDADLERVLVALGSSLEYPPTPPLAGQVGARLRAERGARRPASRTAWPLLFWSRQRLILLVALGLLLVGGAALAARLAIGAIGLRSVPTLPPGTPPPVEQGPALGGPVTLEEARTAVAFDLLLPPGLGRPDRVFLDEGPFGERVVLAWMPRAGLSAIGDTRFGAILMEIGGTGEFGFKDVASKELQPSVEPVFLRVDGHDGVWIQGEHDLVLTTEQGEVRYRVTGHVLLWTRGETTFRLETMLPRAEALAIATSLA